MVVETSLSGSGEGPRWETAWAYSTGDVSRPEEPALRHGVVGHAYQQAGASRPHLARGGHRSRAPTLLGAAGEAIGLDRLMKANTVKTRTNRCSTRDYSTSSGWPP